MDIDPFQTMTTMVQMLRARNISAVELLNVHLERIERQNAELNAIVSLHADSAREAASRADDARASGDDRPLLGVPMTIKDCIDVRGFPTTGGLRDRAGHIAESDARAVSLLRAAGVVIFGKSNVPPYASDWQSDNELFGRSNNPWNLDRTPGGSTGGGAAAVAAGLSPLDLGGDFCGSIRIPAAFCGVYGHKSSVSLVPGTGHFPAGPLPNAALPISALGPLARHAGDLSLALDHVVGAQVDESRGWHVELPPARHTALRDFRVAVLPRLDWQPVDCEIEHTQDCLIERLRAAGTDVREAVPAGLGDLRKFFHDYIAVIAAISSLRQTPDERHWQAERCRSLDDAVLDAWADGLSLSAQQYIELMAGRAEYRASFATFFDDFDVLLSPANIVNAYEHMEAAFPDRLMDEDCRLNVNDSPVVYDRQCVYPSLANFTGLPATAFPVEIGASGLPIGLQVLGPNLEDRTTIAFAGALEQEFGGFVVPPRYAHSDS